MSEKEIAAGDRAAQIEAMLEQSKGTDIIVLLKAKEAAKKAVKDDPSNANLAALQRANRMLEDAQVGTTEKTKTLKTATDVLEYLLKNGRKIKKSKLYQDIKKGVLRRNADLSFSVGNVDKYGTTLPMSETPELVAQDAEERVRRKDNADIRIKEAEARRKELAADVAEGKYIPRENGGAGAGGPCRHSEFWPQVRYRSAGPRYHRSRGRRPQTRAPFSCPDGNTHRRPEQQLRTTP